ncbi:MAG: DUF401 family protein [Spirochaetales bacterium]|nr:DUF401 family protein [Spirochaetales bacterium]
MPQISALAQVLIVFAAVVAATSRKVPLGLAAATGGVVLALWRGVSMGATLRAAAGAAFGADTLLLVVLMICIMAFSSAMKKSGAMDAFAASLTGIAPSPRISMAVAPLLIGTLPVPGGAILSAPLVDAMDPDRVRGADTLAAANYWFRHTLELAWPLFPAFILTASIAGFTTGKLLALNAYAVPLLFTLGQLFILRPSARSDAGEKAGGIQPPGAATDATAREPLSRRLASFGTGALPLAIVLGVYAVTDVAWRALSPALPLSPVAAALSGRYLPIFVGLALGSLYLLRLDGGSGAFRGSLSSAKLVGIILGIKVFSALVGEAGVAGAVSSELASAGVPAVVVIAALPLVAGLVTGLGFGYVGLAFPIVVRLAPAGGQLPLEAAIVLAGAFGYAGMMLSPLHVCMVVSSEHFGVGLASTMRRFAAPLLVFCVVAIGYATLIATVFG